jgi:hypothetical protein
MCFEQLLQRQMRKEQAVSCPTRINQFGGDSPILVCSCPPVIDLL